VSAPPRRGAGETLAVPAGTGGLGRGLDVLVALAEPEAVLDGLGVVRIAELVGAEKSQISRTLQALDERGFVRRDPETLAYRLGWRLFGLAARVADERLVVAAAPVLRVLVRELGESVHLSVRQRDQVLTLLSESPGATLHAPGRVGSLVPMATTSAGRVLAIDLDDTEIEALGLADATAAIRDARAAGFAIVREAFEPGLVAAAAPIRDGAGRIVAAINVSAPRFRFDGRLEAAAHRIAGAATELSRSLAGPPM